MTHPTLNSSLRGNEPERDPRLNRTALDSDIASLPLGKVVQLVAQSEKTWSRARIARAVLAYRCFLQLARDFQERTIVPSPDADVVWHCALQDLGPYLAACDALFGKPLIHFPWAGLRGAADAALQRARFAESSRLLDALVNQVLSTFQSKRSELKE